MQNPRLLSIILNYQTPEMTLKSAMSLLAETKGMSASLVIVDNASGDGSFEKLRAGPSGKGWDKDDNVMVVQSPKNGGFGAGNNFGIRAGLDNCPIPDFIYVLNSDAFPDKGSVAALINGLQQNPKAGFAGSYIHGPDGEPHITAFRFPNACSELEGAAKFGPISQLFKKSIVALPLPEKTQSVDWLAGASLMMRRETLEEIGLFDEAFFLYFEETDLCLRAARAGWQTIYVRESSVTHIGSVSTGMKEWQRMPDFWFNSRRYYFFKNHGRVYAAWATVLHIIGALIHRTRSVLTRRPITGPKWFLHDLIKHTFRFGTTTAKQNVPKLNTSKKATP